jgi:hypothetical protein
MHGSPVDSERCITCGIAKVLADKECRRGEPNTKISNGEGI